MLPLDFSAVGQVEEVLRSAPLEDLVAIFSQASGYRLLLVYNTIEPPTALPDHCEAIRLDDLADVDLETYDGLFSGISALDVIRSDLITKGIGFYSLDRPLMERGQRRILHHTLHHLARYLVGFLNNLPEGDYLRRQRVMIKAPQLALPALLDKRGATGLVAVCPGPDLGRFVAGEAGIWLTVSDNLAAFEEAGEYRQVIALEELSYLCPQVDPSRPEFIELRVVLRRAGQVKALHDTCQALARRFAQAAAGRPEWQQRAWALMTEAWLMEEDVTDLVAFFPHADFEHFSQTGTGLRVYRQLNEAGVRLSPGLRRPLTSMLSTNIPAEFQSYGFALAPLEAFLQSLKGPQVADLGWLLWQAGHDNTLAQTLCQLVANGLEHPALAEVFRPQTLSELAHRAMVLISLGDPWVWRQGRYVDLVCDAYQALEGALQYQASRAKEVDAEYYQALIEWHRCYDPDKPVEEHLRQMAAHLRAFKRAYHDGMNASSSDSRYGDSERLAEVEQTILYPLASRGPDEAVSSGQRATLVPGERGRMRSTAARQQASLSCMSPVFDFAWEKLVALRQERRQVQLYEGNPDILQQKLANLVAEAKLQRRLVFAPLHETRVLHYAYDQEITGLNSHLDELKTAARLQIIPLAPYVEHQKEINITFEICNNGQAEVREIYVILATHPSFEFLDRSSVSEFPRLQPGTRQRLSYRIRAIQPPDVIFNFSYRHEGDHKDQSVLIRLPVRSPEETPFKMKGDPYKFGRTIQNPADFYGREEEMRQLLASLYRGGHANFLLRGPRRMGKSSLLYMLKHALTSPQVRHRFHISPDWDLALRHYIPVMLDLQAFSFRDDVTHVARFFYTLLDTICAAVLPDLRDKLLQRFERRRVEIDAPRAALEQLAEVFQHRPELRVVVLLDEYDEVYRPQGRTLDTALRHVVQEEQRLTWIIASTQFLFKEGKSYGSPWFNILNIVELDCLAPEAARRLVQEPGQNEGVEWQSDALVALLDETGRHPAFLQLFCSQVMAHLNRVRQNYVVPEMITMLAEQIVTEQQTVHSHFEFYWTDTPGVGQLILLAANDSNHPPTRKELRGGVEGQLQVHFGSKLQTRVPDAKGNLTPWQEREFDDSMTWITQVVNAISFNKASRTYTFTVPLFRRWLQRQRRYDNLLETVMNTIAAEMERDGLA